jgi:hypothetical protein
MGSANETKQFWMLEGFDRSVGQRHAHSILSAAIGSTRAARRAGT